MEVSGLDTEVLGSDPSPGRAPGGDLAASSAHLGAPPLPDAGSPSRSPVPKSPRWRRARSLGRHGPRVRRRRVVGPLFLYGPGALMLLTTVKGVVAGDARGCRHTATYIVDY